MDREGLGARADSGKSMLRFLLIRRHIDPWLLLLGMVLMALRAGPEIFIFGFLAAVGLYLIFGWHRSKRHVDGTYATWACLYAAGSVLIGLMHGDFIADVRWIGYPVILLLGVLLAPGAVLIKDPMRQIVLGSRAGLVVAAATGVFEMVSGIPRVGFGGNAATAAFVLVVVGVLARIPVRKPMKLLPNSRLWLYLCAVTIIMTGTRAVLPVFAFGFILDLLALWRGTLFLTLRGAVFAGVAVVLAGVAVFATIGDELAGLVTQRAEHTASELDQAIEGDDQKLMGLGIRMVLWKSAVDPILAHPLIGLGGERSMRQIKQEIPPNARPTFERFNHVHQFALDEMRQRGLVGLVLMLGFFGATTSRLMRRGAPEIREATGLFIVSLLLYGSLHGLLLSERNMALIAIFLSMLLTHLKKEAFWRRVHEPLQPRRA